MLGVNYPGLADMFYEGPNVFKTVEGYRRADEASANNAQNLADAVQAYKHQDIMNPMLEQHQQGLNDLQDLNVDLARAKQPTLLRQAEQVPFDDKGFTALMNHLEGLGHTAVSRGGLSPLDPLAMQLKRSGIPDEILQELSTPEGAARVRDAGKSFRENSAKWQAQESKQDSAKEIADLKAQVDKYKADQRRAADKYAADMRAQVARIMSNAKTKPDQIPKTLDAAIVDATNKAANAGDADTRAFFTSLAQEFTNQKTAFITQQAAARQAGQVDAGAVSGLPTTPTPAPRTVAPPSKAGASQSF